MKHRLYKLESKFTFMGMSWFDWGVILGTFIFSIQILTVLVGPRLKLLLALLVTALVYFVWHLIKDRVPDKFGEHFVTWMGEPEIYKCVPDTQNVPLVVDHEQVRSAKSGVPLVEAGGEVRGTLTFER